MVFFSKIETSANVLDLCCGQGRHSLQLITEYPNLGVHGHDQSEFLVSLAQERASLQHPDENGRPVFTVGDCRTIPYPDNHFDLVIVMGNSFGYFSDAQQDVNVLREIRRVLAPGGSLILDVVDGDYMRKFYEPRSWEWADSNTIVCRERQLSADGTRMYSREIISSTDDGVIRDQFYLERLYSRAELCQILGAEGFDYIPKSFGKGSIESAEFSKRGEDLGMMSHRICLTARKQSVIQAIIQVKQFVDLPILGSAPVPTPRFEEITILMGDPSKPCAGKLNNVWNSEDLETRKRLFAALEISGINFKIIESHEGLYGDLFESRPKFVFNLCDEGFQNDPFKELHVPALLEMLNIPYSGAGPTCLAFCFDKGLVSRSADAIGIPTPAEHTFIRDKVAPFDEQLNALASTVKSTIGFPAFVKPIKGDNSLGITARSIVHAGDDLVNYMRELNDDGICDVLVQEYLQGTEYGVGVVGNVEGGFMFLPILEVDYRRVIEQNLDPILGYESKWDPKSPYWTDISFKRAKLSPYMEESLKKACLLLWERFGCRDYARFDFRCDRGRGDGSDGLSGIIKLLEVNPNPGWCWDGKLAYMAKIAGYGYPDLLKLILNAVYDRMNKNK